MIKRRIEPVIWGAILCLLYVCAGKIGLSLAFTNSSISPVWPPTGLALAALMLGGLGYWPAIFLGAFLVNISVSDHLGSSLVIAVGNTLEAVLGALITRRWVCGETCFGRVPDVFRFVFFAAMPSTLLSAVIGVSALTLTGQIAEGTLLRMGLTWWTGNLVSDLVLAPLLVIWLRSPPLRLTPARWAEMAMLVLFFASVCVMVFGPWNTIDGQTYPLSFLVVPPLLWAAYRFRDRGAVASTAFLSAVSVCATTAGHGPFAMSSSNDSLLMLQAFVGVNSLSMLVVASLVTDRARSADVLLQRQNHLLMALDAGKMGTWDWDIRTGRVRWSAGLEALHGLPPGGFAGTFEAFLADVHPDDRQRVRTEVARALKSESHHTQYRLKLNDDRIRWIEARGQVMRDAQGQPTHLMGVSVDITEQRNAQEERERLLDRETSARAEAERANRSKDNFLAVLSHELRTPLTPVLLTASILEQDPNLSQSVKDDLQMIRRNVEMEARLIDDLLDLTRITRGKLQLQFQTADLHEIIERALDICCRGANVKVRISLDALQRHIRADPGRIQQVLWNLLNNARKFTPVGGTISVRSSNPDPKTIRVEVSDTGVGIPPESIAKLFLAFEQGDSMEAKRAGGLGLGLAISRALVIGHGGTLTARSEGIGHGATFIVTFATVADPKLAAPTNGKPHPEAPAKRARILLVEDNSSTLLALRRLLATKHDVVEATTVASAKEAAAQLPVDLVVSDLGLPDGLGHDLMRDLRQLYGVQGIAISGYGRPEDIDQSREAGFTEHLVKPIDATALEAAVARALRLSGDGMSGA